MCKLNQKPADLYQAIFAKARPDREGILKPVPKRTKNVQIADSRISVNGVYMFNRLPTAILNITEKDMFKKEMKECRSQMTALTNQWYQAIRVSASDSDPEAEELVN